MKASIKQLKVILCLVKSFIVIFLSMQLIVPIQVFANSYSLEENNTENKTEANLPIELSSGAKELANLLKVMPLIEEFYRLPADERGENGSTMSLKALTLRQKILERVTTASLEIDGVLSEIDSEIAVTNEVRSILESKRDRTLAVNNLINFAGSGALGIASGGLALMESTAKAGDIVGIISGGFSLALSAIGIRQEKGKKAPLGTEVPNMLAIFFDRTPEFHSEYPEIVWQYIAAVPPKAVISESRKEQLIKRWLDTGRIDPEDSKKGKEKIDFLTSGISNQRRLSIDILTDRAAMLSDVRARVSLMKRDLSKLMLGIKIN